MDEGMVDEVEMSRALSRDFVGIYGNGCLCLGIQKINIKKKMT